MSELSVIGKNLAIIAVAEVATTELLAAQLGRRAVEQIKENVLRSSYWSDFMQIARAGEVPADWLPGALGSVVLGWAKNGAHAS